MLDSGWRFRVGDNPAWADPAFDDSAWDKVDLASTLTEQGIESYTGYAWYRLRLHPVPVPESGQLLLSLLVVPYKVGQLQVLANGVELTRTKGMQDKPLMYQSELFAVAIQRAAADGTVVIAIRTWSGLSVGHGLLHAASELGDPTRDSSEKGSSLKEAANGKGASSRASWPASSSSASRSWPPLSTSRSAIILNTCGSPCSASPSACEPSSMPHLPWPTCRFPSSTGSTH